MKEERLGAKVAAGDTIGLRGATGTPDQVREYLRRYEEAGVDQVIFVMPGGQNRHEHIMESSSCSAERCSRRSTSATRQVTAKYERLAPAMEAAMARKADQTSSATSATTRSRPSRGSGPTRPGAPRCPSGSTTSPSRAEGKRDEQLGILGN